MQRKLFLLEARGSTNIGASRTGAAVLALVGSLSVAPACTIVIGDAPHISVTDAGADGATELDADGADSEDTPAPDADEDGDGATVVQDASGQGHDASVSIDAGGVDAGGVDAGGSDAGGSDTDGAQGDGATSDAASDATRDAAEEPLDCGSAKVWYPDGDEDDYGRSAESVRACIKPDGKWSLHKDDCKDNDPEVHPGQTAYFDRTFLDAEGNPSYDFDCSGMEEGTPAQTPLLDGCEGLLAKLLTCAGTGYLKTARAGAGVNGFCGSTTVGMCTSPTLLTCQTARQEGRPIYQCH